MSGLRRGDCRAQFVAHDGVITCGWNGGDIIEAPGGFAGCSPVGCLKWESPADCDDCGVSGAEVVHIWNFTLGEVRTVCLECSEQDDYSAAVILPEEMVR